MTNTSVCASGSARAERGVEGRSRRRESVALVQSAAAGNAAVLGASMLAIEHALSPETLTSLVSA